VLESRLMRYALEFEVDREDHLDLKNHGLVEIYKQSDELDMHRPKTLLINNKTKITNFFRTKKVNYKFMKI